MVSHPETGSDPSIGSDLESGRDIKGWRANLLLLLAQGRDRGVLLRKGFKDRVEGYQG